MRVAGFAILCSMAHFPQPHNRMRAPRMRVPNNELVKFNLGSRQVFAILIRLSMTGGLVQFKQPIADLALAEADLTTTSGPVNALVEFLKPQPVGVANSRAFRFVAMDDADFHRLVTTLQAMSKQGWTEDPRRGIRAAS